MKRNSYGFSGIPTFLGADYVPDIDDLSKRDFEVVVLGIPFDEGCPFMPGQRFGTKSIREHSLRFPKDGYYDPEEDKIFLNRELTQNKIVDVGDVDIIPTDIEGNFNRVTDLIRRLRYYSPLIISLGGDHSVTFPIVRGFDDTKIHVIHFDAHADFLPVRPEFQYTNTHPFRHISSMSHVKSLTQVGYRSLRESSGRDSKAAGNRVIGMSEFRKLGPTSIAECVPQGEPCYVSIDIDVLDSSLVPGCVSAEPNGMTYKELIDTLSAIAKRAPVVGIDMVEVAPQLDVGTGITSYLASQIVVEFLGKVCDQKV